MDAAQNGGVVDVQREEWEMDAQLKARASAALVTAEAAQHRARVLEKLLEESLESLSKTLKKCLDSHDELRRRLTRLETANKQPNPQIASRYELRYLEERYKALEVFVRKSLDTLFAGKYSSDGHHNEDDENETSYILGKNSTLPSHLHFFQTSVAMYPEPRVSDSEVFPFAQKLEDGMFNGVRYRSCEADLNILDNNDHRNSAPVPATRHLVQSPTPDRSSPVFIKPTNELVYDVSMKSRVPTMDPPWTIPRTLMSDPAPLRSSPVGEISPHSQKYVEPASRLEQSPVQGRSLSHFSFSFPKPTPEEIEAASPRPHKSSTICNYVYTDPIDSPPQSVKGSLSLQSSKFSFSEVPPPPRNFPKPVNKLINDIGSKPPALSAKSQASSTIAHTGDRMYHISPENSTTTANSINNTPYSSFPTNSQISIVRTVAEEPRFMIGSRKRVPDDALRDEKVEYINVYTEADSEAFPDAPPLPPRSTISPQSEDIPSVTRAPDQVKNNGVKALLRAVPSLIVGSSPKKDKPFPKKETAADPKCSENDAVRKEDEAEGPEAALLRAAKLNDVRMCEELLAKHGSGLTACRDLVGDTPAHWAAHAGHEEVLKALVNGGADVDARGAGGRTPLHYAAFQGRTSCIVVLLEGRANPDLRTGNGITPLHLTALRGHREAAIKLIAGGADPLGKESAGRTAAQLATDKDLRKVLERAEAGGNVPVAR